MHAPMASGDMGLAIAIAYFAAHVESGGSPLRGRLPEDFFFPEDFLGGEICLFLSFIACFCFLVYLGVRYTIIHSRTKLRKWPMHTSYSNILYTVGGPLKGLTVSFICTAALVKGKPCL